MSVNILQKVNQYLKKERPCLNPYPVCDTFRAGSFAEACFLSNQCVNDASGRCIMCDYGYIEGTHTPEEYIRELEIFLDSNRNAITTLLLCTNGSIFHHRQFPVGTLKRLLDYVSKTNIPSIEFECHYLDVTPHILDMIKSCIPDKEILIEMGFETANQLIQDWFIMKHIRLDTYKEKIHLIRAYNYKIELNILLGMPFLSAKEQLEDAKQSCDWAFAHNCRVVLFPLNIKPYTLLMHMYDTGKYSPISEWMMIYLLEMIPENFLTSTSVAWFGNREYIYGESSQRTIFPCVCPKCKYVLMNFFNQFNECPSASQRKSMLSKIVQKRPCRCYDHLLKELAYEESGSFQKRYDEYNNFLLEHFSFLFSNGG